MASSSASSSSSNSINPFAAYCPVQVSGSGQNNITTSTTSITNYSPPAWIATFSTYFVEPFRNGNETENALLTQWMRGDDQTPFALSVVAAWGVLTGVLLVWMLLMWVVPKLVNYKRRRNNNSTAPIITIIPDISTQEQVGGNVVELQNNKKNMLLLQQHNNDDKVQEAEEEEKMPEEGDEDCSAITHHEYPSRMETSTLQLQLELEQQHLNNSMVSALSEVGVEEEAPPMRSLSLQYLQYCNTPSKSMNDGAAPTTPCSQDADSSIDLLSISTASSGITSSRTPTKAPVDDDENNDASFFSPMKMQILDVTEDGNVATEENTNVSSFQDVLRNVYLGGSSSEEPLLVSDDDEHEEVPSDETSFASSSTNNRVTVTTYPLHPSFQLNGLTETNQEHALLFNEFSTIAPTETSFAESSSMQHIIMDSSDNDNDNLALFQDNDEDDDSKCDRNERFPSFLVPTAHHLPPTSSLTRKANAATSASTQTTTTTTAIPTASSLPPLTMATASSIIRHRKRLLEDYVQSFRTNVNNTAPPTHTTTRDQATSTALEDHNNTTTKAAAATQTPETSPTSTIGRGLEDSHNSAAFVFQDEHDDSSHDVNSIAHGNDETQSNIAVVETTTTTANAAKKKRSVNFAANNQAIHRPRSASPPVSKSSFCQNTIAPMVVLAACTVLIVAVILFGMNGVWALHSTTQQAEAAWDRLAQHFLVQVPASLQEREDAQRRVLQQTWNVWQSLDSNCPKRQGKVCDGEFNRPSVDAIDAFWQDTNTTIECQIDGLPLSAIWKDWTSVAQPLFMKNVTAPQDVLVDAKDAAIEFWDDLDQDVHATYEPLWDWTLYVAMAANACLAFLSFGIMWMISVPSGRARSQRRQCRLDAPFCWCTRRSFAVLFWFFFLFAWAFGMWFSIGTVLTTDVCGTSDAPNSLGMELMERWTSRYPSAKPLMSRWMTAFQDNADNGCSSIQTQDELDAFQWLGLVEPTHRIATALQDLPPNIYFDICGTALWPLQNSVDRLSEQLCDFTGILMDDASSDGSGKQCGSDAAGWYPDYADIMFVSVCEQGSKALVWVTATQALIVFMVMITWTFRSAFLPEPLKTGDSSNGSGMSWCCKRILSSCSSFPTCSQWRSGRSSNNKRWYLSKNASSYSSHHSSTGSSSGDEEGRKRMHA